MRTFIVGFALVLVAAPAFAQTNSDERWTPWLGCWDLVLESAQEGPPPIDSPRERSRPSTPDSIRPRVCVERAPSGGATFRTTIGTQSAISQTLVADGTDRPVTDADCQGTQRAEWSRNGLRLFVKAELTCKGDSAQRRVSGFAMLGPNATWTDVQAIDAGGRETYRVRRYRRVDAATIGASGMRGAALSLEDVKEASGKVSPPALEAALVETHAFFRLTGERLIDLADAKVPERVIDLLVALSYPKRFVIETTRADRAHPAFDDPFQFGFGLPAWYDPFGFSSPLYGYYSPYYYSPFAYSYARGYNPFFTNGGYVVIDAGGGGGVGRPDRPSGSGRVVDGQGYTRVRPREPDPVATARPGSTPGASGDSGGSSSSSSGSSGSSSVSSGGFSSGSSSSDTGRTAQPR